MDYIVSAEYIWLGGDNEFRSKIKTVYLDYNDDMIHVLDLSNYPEWSYDGSSTNQANGDDSEVILKPQAVFSNPNFGEGLNQYVLVLCDTYTPQGVPLSNNHRVKAVELFNKKVGAKPWYGIEQEFYITEPECNHASEKSMNPLGCKTANTQGQYYCSVGSANAFGRDFVMKAYNCCLNAGLKISGMNAEVAPGQWEIQVGPCEGIESGDHLMMCRYILHRVSEKYNVQVNFEPKLLKGDWNGSGCHVNYSTLCMREQGGYSEIINAIEKLKEKHNEHMECYGEGNEERMTGLHETSSYDKFTYGVADRTASVRIPRQTEKEQKGYLEDRRPASNIDPYLVTSKLFETTVL